MLARNFPKYYAGKLQFEEKLQGCDVTDPMRQTMGIVECRRVLTARNMLQNAYSETNFNNPDIMHLGNIIGGLDTIIGKNTRR